jgi:hypothetical protein
MNRKRPDILSVLIVKLFEDENDELAAELRNTQRCLLDGYIEDNYEEDLDTDWRPTLTCLGSKGLL